MIRSSAVRIGAGVADNAAVAGLRATASTPVGAFGILNIGVELLDSTATEIGLLVPATAGTASTTDSGVVENVDGGIYSGASLTMRVASAWSVAPTFDVSPSYARRVLLPSKGASVEWSWPPEQPWVPTSSLGAMLRNLTGGAAGALAVYFRWCEQRTLMGDRRVSVLSPTAGVGP